MADRYGREHRKLRRLTRDQAIGTPCARCGGILREGQAVHLDHADDGDGYLGWSHQSCNARAGAVAGNRARAAAYRAAMGLPPAPSSAVAKEPPAERPACQRTADASREERLRCICGSHSRCW